MLGEPSGVVYLDRDGTIIEDAHYLADPRLIKFLPSAISGLKKMYEMSLQLVIVTNQSGINRGYFGLAQLNEIHNDLSQMLTEKGVKLERIEFCPHLPEENCRCRKPNVGLIERAQDSLSLTNDDCFVVGDKACDIELGQNIGATTFLVDTMCNYGECLPSSRKADYVVANLYEAAEIIEKILMTAHD